jgi:outer membrane lipoprotein
MCRRTSNAQSTRSLRCCAVGEPILRFGLRLFCGLGLVGFLAGCASGVPSGVAECRTPVGDQSLTPALVAERDAVSGDWQTWGGKLVQARHREDTTELELAAYPLTDCGRPRLDATSVGRFIIVVPGYLETADLSSGQPLTATGRLLGIREGDVGGQRYRFPLLEDPAPRVWGSASSRGRQWRPVVSIGIGVGSGWRGGGVGINF